LKEKLIGRKIRVCFNNINSFFTQKDGKIEFVKSSSDFEREKDMYLYSFRKFFKKVLTRN